MLDCCNVFLSSRLAYSPIERLFGFSDFAFFSLSFLLLSTQIIGFSYAGFSRKWLVWPAAAIWPSALVQTVSLHLRLHDHLSL